MGRPWVRCGAGLLGLILAVGPVLAGPVGAEGVSAVNAWVTVGTTAPGIACGVPVSVEVREAGYTVGGADITVALAIGGEVVSLDRAVTDSDGLAYLGIDTSGAYDGANGWLDVLINGTYAGGMSITPVSGNGCDGAESLTSLEATVSLAAVSSAAESFDAGAEISGGGSFIGVPTYVQQRNLSCEYAALAIATGAFGNSISEYAFDEVVGWSANPHWGYRGDINGWWGNTSDYGVYPSALAPALAHFGFSGEVFYGAGDATALQTRLDWGMPTLVWLGMWGDTSYYESTGDGASYNLTPGMHVMVAYGYDAAGVYLSDPGSGSYRYYDWGTFLWMWNVLDGMSLAVAPA